MIATTRQIAGCWNSARSYVHGLRGTADLANFQIDGPAAWGFHGRSGNPYQAELDALLEAIRQDKPHNEVEAGARTTMTAILGRLATYSGQMVTWEQALNSKVSLAPERYAFDAPPPVIADAAGNYPMPSPALARFFDLACHQEDLMLHYCQHVRAVGLRLFLICAQFVLATAILGNDLANPGFEEAAGGKLAGWTLQGEGNAIDRQTVHGGRQSLCCEAADGDHTYGAAQVIRYDRPDRRPIIAGGWSKAQNVAGGDYCVFLDVIYADGTPWWGLISDWLPGTHDWQYTADLLAGKTGPRDPHLRFLAP